MQTIRWGIIGCGNVTEVKSGPGFQEAEGSELVAVMRRDAELAADYARRHGVPRSYGNADDLIEDPDVDAIYVATPPSSHCELSLKVADAGKPCFVEKPMAMNYAECQWMVEAFKRRGMPLYVAYYRRAFPMFLKVRELLKEGAIGTLSSVHIVQYGTLDTGDKASGWRYDPEVGGGGLFMDVGSHGLDILDFLISPITAVGGFSLNTGGAYAVEDVTAAAFEFESGCVGTGIWNFNADHSKDLITLTGSGGEIRCPVFSDGAILIKKPDGEESIDIRKPEHVHQPMIQTIVDELLGKGLCESTGESGARTGRVMEECLKAYYGRD
ncbi:MAG: Gfo/Idh/MocA family oxidoreductase [Candidatus Latescibacteria bacterium]|jgi:predicted dehydrogenase|nr:Gfo/Idh/MocA family oxidoreductase [Candidatus Latescibacterota bacterium]